LHFASMLCVLPKGACYPHVSFEFDIVYVLGYVYSLCVN